MMISPSKPAGPTSSNFAFQNVQPKSGCKLREIRVISRSSAFSFKGQSLPASEIAERLNVRYTIGLITNERLTGHVAGLVAESRATDRGVYTLAVVERTSATPIGAVALALAALWLDEERQHDVGRLDVAGLVLVPLTRDAVRVPVIASVTVTDAEGVAAVSPVTVTVPTTAGTGAEATKNACAQLDEDQDVLSALKVMHQAGVNHLVVSRAEGDPVGVVSSLEIIRLLGR